MKRKHKDLRHGQYLVNFYKWLEKVIDDESAIFYLDDKSFEKLEKAYKKHLK